MKSRSNCFKKYFYSVPAITVDCSPHRVNRALNRENIFLMNHKKMIHADELIAGSEWFSWNRGRCVLVKTDQLML